MRTFQSARIATYATLAIAAAVVLALLAFKAFISGFFSTNLYQVELSGRIVDKTTGASVPAAHVVVVLNTKHITPQAKCFGIIADAQGDFRMSYKSPIALLPELSIYASAPNNHWGGIGTPDILKAPDRIEASNLVVEVGPKFGVSEWYNTYEHFNPGCYPHGRITFLNGAWYASDRDVREQ